MKKLFTMLCVGLLILISGCTSLTKPRDVKDSLAYAWAGYTAVVRSITVLVRNDVISKDDVRVRQPDLQDARDALSTAGLLIEAGDLEGAKTNIATANKILLLLRTYLRELQKKENQAMLEIIPKQLPKLVPV